MITVSPHWEHFSHAADIGIRGIANSIAGAFEQGALAMTAVITNPALISDVETVEIHCQAPDEELLFIDWLNALVYQMAVNKMLFAHFDVRLENTTLHAKAWGEKVNISKHQPAVEVKGATYTELKVMQQQNGSWLAQCVIDV